MNRRNKDVVPAMLFGGMSVMAAIVAVWFGVETKRLATRERPITWYVRNESSWHPGFTAILVALLGFALGSGLTHFVWDYEENP